MVWTNKNPALSAKLKRGPNGTPFQFGEVGGFDEEPPVRQAAAGRAAHRSAAEVPRRGERAARVIPPSPPKIEKAPKRGLFYFCWAQPFQANPTSGILPTATTRLLMFLRLVFDGLAAALDILAGTLDGIAAGHGDRIGQGQQQEIDGFEFCDIHAMPSVSRCRSIQ